MKKTPFQLAVEDEGVKSNKVARERYGKLWEAYEKACAVLGQLAARGAEVSDGHSHFEAERLSLTANMLQGCFLIENLISSGYYVASIAVLRQQMETLARIIELRKGIKKQHKTPNVSHLPFKLSQNYGRLSQIFHTSGEEYLDCFAEESDGEVASYLPVYRQDWSRILLAIHIAHLVVLAGEIGGLHHDLYRSQQPAANISAELFSIGHILVETGFWERFDLDK